MIVYLEREVEATFDVNPVGGVFLQLIAVSCLQPENLIYSACLFLKRQNVGLSTNVATKCEGFIIESKLADDCNKY